MVAISKQQAHQTIHPKSDRVAVLLMGYGEVENYKDFANYNEQALHLLTAKFAPVPTWVYPPLAKLLSIFDLHEWQHQHDHFISPHNEIFERQRVSIERSLQEKWGNSQVDPTKPRVQVFKAFNFCKPFLPKQVLENVRMQGFDRLLIYPLLVVDSIFTSGIAIEQVNEALADLSEDKVDEHWLKDLRYIPSFYNQPAYINLLAKLVEDKITQELADDFLASQIGIILMNHGCPHEAKGFTSGIDESQALYELVREKLIHRYPLISVGWLNHQTPMIKWTQPNVTLAAKNLLELGAKALIFSPIGFATENHETILDVDHIIHHLQHQFPEIHYIQMSCVNDHSEFCQMAADWADNSINELLKEEKPHIQLNITPSSTAYSYSDHHAPGHHHHH